MPNSPESGIRARVQAFAEEISTLIQISVLEVASMALGGGGGTASAGARRSPRLTSDRAAPGRKGAKRAPDLLAATVSDLSAYIAKNPGQRMEEIARGLGLSTRELTLPARKLLADGRLKTEGEKRATRYFPAGGRAAKGAAKPAPKRASSAKKAEKKTAKRAAKKTARRGKKAGKRAAKAKRGGRRGAGAVKARAAGRKPRAAKKTAKRAAKKSAPKPKAAKGPSKAPPAARASAAPPAEKAPEATPPAE